MSGWSSRGWAWFASRLRVDVTWKRILNGESGARKIRDLRGRRSFQPDRLRGAARRRQRRHLQSRPVDGAEGPAQVDDFIIFAMCAARSGARRCNWHPETEEDKCADRDLIGSGSADCPHCRYRATAQERGPRKVSPFFIPGRLINLASVTSRSSMA